MKIYRGGFTYGRAPLGPHASCVHEVSRYGVHARRVRSQAHTANGSASYFRRDTKTPILLGRIGCSSALVIDLQAELDFTRVIALLPHPSEAKSQGVASEDGAVLVSALIEAKNRAVE